MTGTVLSACDLLFLNETDSTVLTGILSADLNASLIATGSVPPVFYTA